MSKDNMEELVDLLKSGEFWAGITAFCVVVVPLFAKKAIKRRVKRKTKK